SPDGKRLAAAGGRNGSRAKIKVWRVGDHEQLCEIITGGDGAIALALSSDGHLGGGAGADGRGGGWGGSEGQTQRSPTLSGALVSVRFSRDSRRLLVRSEDGTESQFDAGNGRPVTDRGH